MSLNPILRRMRQALQIGGTGAHVPKSAPHRRNIFSRTPESYGHQQIYDSSAAFDLKSLNPILRRMRQGLQIGGTSSRSSIHNMCRKVSPRQSLREALERFSLAFVRVDTKPFRPEQPVATQRSSS